MARRHFDVFDIAELLQHWSAGRAGSVIADSLGVDRGTVRKYIRRAESLGLTQGGPPRSPIEWAAIARQVAPELVDPKERSLTYEVIDTHRELVKEMLEQSTMATVHQRLRDEHSLTVSLSSFRRYCQMAFPEKISPDKVTVLRPDVDPADEAQIDYGYLGKWFDPVAERFRRVWAFVMVLAFSRHMFVRPVLKMDKVSWCESHVLALEYFGGCPKRFVLDNLKNGVLKPDVYDPGLNRTYAELGNHFGVLIDPARLAKPKDKPRVERQMPYVRDSFWSGRSYADEADMQSKALRWCSEVAGLRIHGTTRMQPLRHFEAEEASSLAQLPMLSFELASWSRAKVGPDLYVKVGRALYTVHWLHMGKVVDAREGYRTVEIFHEGSLIKTWARVEKGRQRDWADYPPEKAAFFMKNPAWCRHRAAELGEPVTQVVEGLLANGALYNLRGAQGVLRLAERYETARLLAACSRAIEIGDPAYRTIKGILVAGTENEGAEEPAHAEQPAHLHGQERLFDHLDEGSAS